MYYYVLVTSKDPKQLCNRRKTFKASLGKCGLTPEWIRPLTAHLQRMIGFGHANLTKDEFQQACSNVANVQQASELKKLCHRLQAFTDVELLDFKDNLASAIYDTPKVALADCSHKYEEVAKEWSCEAPL